MLTITTPVAQPLLPPGNMKIDIELERKDGVTIFKFNVDPAITRVYEKQMQEIKESVKWPGLKFFAAPSLTQNQSYKAMLQEYNLFDDYGQPIYAIREGNRMGSLNIAWIRTVGGTGEIVVNDTISIAEMSQLIKKTTQFIKQYFQEHLRGAQIKGHVEIDI